MRRWIAVSTESTQRTQSCPLRFRSSRHRLWFGATGAGSRSLVFDDGGTLSPDAIHHVARHSDELRKLREETESGIERGVVGGITPLAAMRSHAQEQNRINRQ